MVRFTVQPGRNFWTHAVPWAGARTARRRITSDAGELPVELSSAFIGALKEVLSELIKIPVTLGALQEALLTGGSPATPDELKKRFEEFLTQLSKGKDVGKVRIVIEG